jgi:exodeoxyribonuclease VII large subunit
MQKNIMTISELNQAAQKLLEGHFSTIWVEGEISNFTRPSSGHTYFSLKDSQAQVRCAMFRLQNQQLTFEPRAGLLVQAKAKVSIYPDRGDYQLIVESMTLAGDGQLRLAYEKLLKKLAALGLFQEQFKKPLPTYPKQVGVITSATGAAIRDILTVLKRRFPKLSICIYPTKVQGSLAAAEIVQAINLANRHAVCDVLILARGGGSLEDLWPFNEEIVAHAIFESKIPIVTGIGHEIDITIADYVGDRRAATPSAAAELVSPLQQELLQKFIIAEKRLISEIRKRLNYRAQRLDDIFKRLRHPKQSLQVSLQRLQALNNRLFQAIQQVVKDRSRQLASASRALESVSPLGTLGRGYAIVTLAKQEKILRSVKSAVVGEALAIKLKDGELRCVTTEIKENQIIDEAMTTA